MGFGYDIFKKSQDGSPIWIMQAMTLEDARDHIKALVLAERAEYFIRNAATEQVLAPSDSPLRINLRIKSGWPVWKNFSRVCSCRSIRANSADGRVCVESVTT
jgi:hypothetical protein